MKRLTLRCLGISSVVAIQAVAQQQPGTLLWSYQGPGYPSALNSVALGSDAVVYLGTTYTLYAVTNSGGTASNKWTFSIVAAGAPAIAPDGTIYATSQDGLTAVGSEGTQKWFYSAGGGYGSPAIGADNAIYILAGDSLFAISAGGTKLWQTQVGTGNAMQSPVIGPDSNIYIALRSSLRAVSPAGSNLWSSSLSSISSESPAINSAGNVIAASGSLFLFTPLGTNIWMAGYGESQGSPVVGRDGTIYVSAGRRSLTSVGAGGTGNWAILQGPPYGNLTSPAIDAGGMIYYCVSNSVWAISPQGQIKWNFTSPEFFGSADVAGASPIIGPDGTVYAAIGSKLYAFASGTNGPADSTWPMYRQNARHTGKIEKPSLRPPQKRADANFNFRLYGQIGGSFTIEGSTNLNTWTSLTSFVATTVPMDVVDTQATNSPFKFYRATETR